MTAALNERHLEGQAAYEIWSVITSSFKEKLNHMMSDVYCSAGKSFPVEGGLAKGGVASMEEK